MKIKLPFFQPKPIGLKGRALINSSLPVLIIGIVMAFLFIHQRFDELDDNLEKQGTMIAAAYAHGIFESLSQRQGHTLPFYAQRILEEDNVRSVAIHEIDGTLLTRAGPKMHPLPEGVALLPTNDAKTALARYTDSTLRVIHPIYPASSYHPLAGDQPNAGWIDVEIDRSNTVIQKYRNALYSTLLLFFALALNAVISMRFSGRITQVVSNTRSALNQMSEGNLKVHVEENAYGELLDLQASLNQLSASIEEGQQELQQNVDQATEDLRETLETIEIQNIELDLARKEALEASRIKSEFLANMSHEIRTPLNGIIGFTNLLLRSSINLTQRDYLDTIQKSSESLLSIINDILDFSKIEAGKLALDQTPLNFQQVVEDVLTMLAPMAYEKHLEQVSLFYSDVPTGIVGDPLRLKQILTNLVNNAIKFTDNGEVVVRVMLDAEQNNIATIKVTVSDTGIGLDKGQQQALFRAFRQADPTTARRFGGTGLGLVISKHLVEQMHGNIGLESEPGKGATFWFTFKAEIHNKNSEQLPLMHNEDFHIVVYDSNPTVRANLMNTLKFRSIKVTEASELNALQELVKNPNQPLPNALILGINAQKPLYTDIVNLYKSCNQRAPIILHGNPADQTVMSELLGNVQLPLITKPLCEQRCYEVIGNLQSGGRTHHPITPFKYNSVTSLTIETMQVIVVDDNAANLKLLCALLNDLSVSTTACDSGIKALQQIESRKFDLVLMDIQMPVMDGVETARRIRAMEHGEQRIPIIAVTAHALASEKHHLLNSGMDDYVTKPINEAQLIHIIQKWTGVNLNADTPKQSLITPPSPVEAVDMGLGLTLANNKPDLAEDMLEMLFNSLQKDREVIRTLLEDQDFEALQEVVHKLHGATRYTGVPVLQFASQELEEALKLVHIERAPSLTEKLLIEIDRVVDWCKKNRDMVGSQ